VEFSRLRYPKSAAASWPTPPAVLDAAPAAAAHAVESMLFDDIEVAVRIVELLRLDDRTLASYWSGRGSTCSAACVPRRLCQ